MEASHRRKLAAVVLGATLATNALGIATATDTKVPEASRVSAGVEERSMLGLRADEEYVRWLISSGEDVGSQSVGIVLTADELRAIDIDERAAYEERLSQDLVPYARTLPDFGGAYFDQRNGGGLVILLVGLSPLTVEDLISRAPEVGQPVRFADATYTYASLKTGVDLASSVWRSVLPRVELQLAALDVMRNAVRLEVSAADLPAGLAGQGLIEAELGVRVLVVAGRPGDEADQVCLGRHTCYNPTEAGTFIAQNTSGGTTFCAMGFHISIGTNEQFITSGHCGLDQYTYWYQLYGIGLGYEAGNVYSYGFDAMKVELSDVQASDWVYGRSHSYHAGGYRYPIYGESVYASLPKQGDLAAPDWGYIADEYLSYSGMYGAKAAGLYIQQGDSGAPVWHQNGYQLTGLGIVARTDGIFAVLADFMPIWGATVY